jgi:hypothetical protein
LIQSFENIFGILKRRKIKGLKLSRFLMKRRRKSGGIIPEIQEEYLSGIYKRFLTLEKIERKSSS